MQGVWSSTSGVGPPYTESTRKDRLVEVSDLPLVVKPDLWTTKVCE